MEPIEEKKYNWLFLSQYLISSLNKVKQSVKDCTYLSFLESKDPNTEKGTWEPFIAYYAIMKNSTGGKDRLTLKLDKPSFELKKEDFRNLANYLGNKLYEKEGERSVQPV